MAISAAIGLGAAAIGGSMYSSRQMRKAAEKATPAPPEIPQPVQNNEPPDPVKRARGRRGGNRSGTVLTSPSGIPSGQTYEGQTLLGG